MNQKKSGILFHISSFPGLWGKGDFGPSVYEFIDWLQETGQTLWQILPLSFPDDTGSPYASPSSAAIDRCFISPEMLLKENWITAEEFKKADRMKSDGKFDPYEFVLYLAFQKYQNGSGSFDMVERFFHDHATWLDDTALFMILHDLFSSSWLDFPDHYKNREPEALAEFRLSNHEKILKFKFEQYLLFHQWFLIKNYANKRGICIIGDIPIFVSGDSADVWANRHLFKLNENGIPLYLTGVPPDLFTETGQLWGQPHYRWDIMKKNDYQWWQYRMKIGLLQADIVRIDHFRGFCAAWEIPYGEPTAENGKWIPGPGIDIFGTLHRRFPDMCIIAEDLGVITDDVVKLRKKLDYPGMKILQFAFNSNDANEYLPANFDRDDKFVVYTGTHDNNTTRGWYRHSTPHEKYMLSKYYTVDDENISWTLIEAAHESSAMWAVVPIQDVLNLGESARMNCPGTINNNWVWQLNNWDPDEKITRRLKALTIKSGRYPEKRNRN